MTQFQAERMVYTDSYSRLTRRIAETLAILLFASVLVVQAVNIFFRYSQVAAPWEWVEEFSKFALIWMFFLLWHLSDREQRHFAVDFLAAKMPPRLRHLCDALGHLIAVVFTSVVVVSWPPAWVPSMMTGSRFARAV